MKILLILLLHSLFRLYRFSCLIGKSTSSSNLITPRYKPISVILIFTVFLYRRGIPPAVPAGELSFPVRSIFKCNFPTRARRSLPFKQPTLRSSSSTASYRNSPSPELLRWTFLVYDSLATDNDVNRQIRALQEVFWCKTPDILGKEPISVSIGIVSPLLRWSHLEWVLYHSRIGVEKFILYDNGSDDDLATIVDELVEEGYDVKNHFWLRPKSRSWFFS
ncbi:hypothetical protein HAX54_032897 [Datura stramonium]|uniref:Glycosyltransferase family 92 protein n=1 Tax=Datura stramonium TaxID=4076 RepID=A0ABS8RM70_DATST|nr:hypothetical protein [Datura stramonium]